MNLRAYLRNPLHGPSALLAVSAVGGGVAVFSLIQSALYGILYPLLDLLVGINPVESFAFIEDRENFVVFDFSGVFTDIITVAILWLIVANLFPLLWARYMEATVECPFCLSDVPAEASKCRYCGSDLPSEETTAAP